jgi:hypothetical protein
LAAALTVAVAVAITVAPEQGRPPDSAAYALAPVIGALALFRRRWPLAVLLASAVALFLYNLTDKPGLFSSMPLSVALVTAWAAGRQWAERGKGIQGGAEQGVVIAICRGGYRAQWDASGVGDHGVFEACLPRSTLLGLAVCPPQGALVVQPSTAGLPRSRPIMRS